MQTINPLNFTKTQYVNMYLELGGVLRDETDSNGSVWPHQWDLVYCALNGHEIRCGMKNSIRKILEERGLAKAKMFVVWCCATTTIITRQRRRELVLRHLDDYDKR